MNTILQYIGRTLLKNDFVACCQHDKKVKKIRKYRKK